MAPLAVPLLIATAAGAAAQVAGGIQQGRSAREQSCLQRDVAVQNGEFQSDIARQKADLAERTGQIEEDRIRRENFRRQGTLTAALAARGVDIGSGSPMEALAQSAFELEQTALLSRLGAQAEARRQRFAGDIALQRGVTEGRLARFQGSVAEQAFLTQGVTSAIGTIGAGTSSLIGLGGGGGGGGGIAGIGGTSTPSFAGAFA